MAYKVKQNLQRIKAAADDIREVIDLCYEEVGDDERIEDYAPKLARLAVDDATEQVIATAARTTAGGVAIKDTIAVVDKVYGNTIVWNQLCDKDDPTKDLNMSGTTLVRTNKVWSFNGTPTTNTDIIFNLTRMFGAGQEPTTIDDFCLKIFGKESASVTDAEWEAISAFCEPTLLSSKPKKVVSKERCLKWNQIIPSSFANKEITKSNFSSLDSTMYSGQCFLKQGCKYYAGVFFDGLSSIGNFRFVANAVNGKEEDNYVKILSVSKSFFGFEIEHDARFGVRGTNNIADGDVFHYSAFCVNLTEMFGKGNEPTAEEFAEMFSRDYYPYREAVEVPYKDIEKVAYPDNVVWNQGSNYVKSLTENLNGFYNNDDALSISFIDNSIVVSGTSTTGWVQISKRYEKVQSGHIFLVKVTKISGEIVSGGSITTSFISGYTNSLSYIPLNEGGCKIFTPGVSQNGLSYAFGFWGNAGDVYNDLRLQIILCDLTTMFGVGCEPTTIDEFTKFVFGKASADVTDADWESISAYNEGMEQDNPLPTPWSIDISVDPTAILDENGEQVFPNGLMSAGNVRDEMDIEQGIAIKRVSADNSTLTTSALATPIEYPLPKRKCFYRVSNGGKEYITSDGIIPMVADIGYREAVTASEAVAMMAEASGIN